MSGTYTAAFIMAFFLSLLLTPWMRRIAFKIGAVDNPSPRKVHEKPVARLGGVAIVLAVLATFLAFWATEISRPILGLLGGMLVLLAVGVIDDVKGLPARSKLLWQVIAAVVVLAGGIGIVYVSNPFNGVLQLDSWKIMVELGAVKFNILPMANLVSIIWIIGMINAVNLLDGLDGLAGGVSAIAALVLFILAVTPALDNALVALLSIVLLGAILGFLPYNFFPSSIFMGDSGAYVIGLLLALLSIYAGSKIAVGALVMGFAIIDMIWAFLRRIVRKQSPFASDRGHLHHKLLDSGLVSHRKAVLIFYVLAALVAVTILLAGGVAAFSLLIILLVGVLSVLRILSPYRTRRL